MESQNPQNTPQPTINTPVTSANNSTSNRSYIPTAFAIAIVCFFFTFCDVNCNGTKIASLKGTDFVTGKEITQPNLIGKSRKEKLPSNIWAILSLGAAIVGFGVFQIKEKNEAVIGIGAGVVGVGALLMLQNVVNNQLSKETEGMVSADFKAPYWVAVGALAVAAWFSYQRTKQTQTVVASSDAVPPGPASDAVQTEQPPQVQQLVDVKPQAQAIIQPVPQQTGGTDIVARIKNNTKTVIGLVVLAGALYAGYYFFLMHDPERDAKKAIKAMCDCGEKEADAEIKVYKDFLNSFDSYKFQRKQEARDKLAELRSSAAKIWSECNPEFESKYTELRKRYLNKEEELQKFDAVTRHGGDMENCNAIGSSLSEKEKSKSDWRDKVDKKINAIKDADPDIAQIKSDLIGRDIPGWHFQDASEIKQAIISNTTRGDNSIEYTVDLHMEKSYPAEADANSGMSRAYIKGANDAQIVVLYSQANGEDWSIYKVRENYITYTYTAPVNEYEYIPLESNSSYSIDANGHRFWIKDSGFWEYKGGGNDADQYQLTGSMIYVKSREAFPVNLTITYRPN